MKYNIEEYCNHFRKLLESQLLRCERMEKESGRCDFSKKEKIIIGVIGGDGDRIDYDVIALDIFCGVGISDIDALGGKLFGKRASRSVRAARTVALYVGQVRQRGHIYTADPHKEDATRLSHDFIYEIRTEMCVFRHHLSIISFL